VTPANQGRSSAPGASALRHPVGPTGGLNPQAKASEKPAATITRDKTTPTNRWKIDFKTKPPAEKDTRYCLWGTARLPLPGAESESVAVFVAEPESVTVEPVSRLPFPLFPAPHFAAPTPFFKAPDQKKRAFSVKGD
jgi:hypothetical protein